MHFVVNIFLASLLSGVIELTMISFSIVFLLPLTFFLLRSVSTESNSFYLSFLFHSSPTLSMSLLMQSPSQFRSSLPPFPLYFLDICSLCQSFLCHSVYRTSSCTRHQFLLRTHSNLHCQFIIFFLSALLTPMIILSRLLFANLEVLLFLS